MQPLIKLYPFTAEQAEPFSEHYLKPQALAFTSSYEQEVLVSRLVRETDLANSTIEAIFELALKVNVVQPLFVKGSKPLPDCFVKKNKLKRSVVLLRDDTKILAFVTRRLAIRDGLDEKERVLRLFKSVLFTFDAEGKFQTLTQTMTFLCRYKKLAQDALPGELVRRFSIMQALSGSSHTPKTYAYIKYRGKYGNNLAVYQQRGMYDLRDFLLEPIYSPLRTTKNRLLIAREILEAVIYMHNKGYVHKDLKTANFLLYPHFDADLEEIGVKITDFGLSRSIKDTDGCRRCCGTLDCLPPEFLTLRSNASDNVQEAWEVGLVLYQLACNEKAPIHLCQLDLASLRDEMQSDTQSVDDSCPEDSNFQIRRRVLMKRWNTLVECLPRPKQILSLKDIAQWLLQKDPQERLELAAALRLVNRLINEG